MGFGRAPLGNLYRKVSDEDAQSALQAAFDAGIRFFDTAPQYGLGRSERASARRSLGLVARILNFRPRSGACCWTVSRTK
ncbi:aldo/keto reductase [Ruegeria lacuscaerulensis]|uniref:aldo/keto reductase n=1 Tax=Ruegeria lacuscaerulensis TaxID=55218 RepID=UPI0030133905